MMRRAGKIMSDLQTLYPLAEEGVDETVRVVVPVDEILLFNLRHGFLGRGPVVHIGGFKRFGGEDFLSLLNGDHFEHSLLKGCELFDAEHKMVLLSGVDEIKRQWNVLLCEDVTARSCLPNGFAKLLCIAGIPARDAICSIKDILWKGSFRSGEAFLGKREETVVFNLPDRERRCGMIEWAFVLEEDVCHAILHASKKNVGCAGVKLYSRSHYGKNPLAVFDVKYVLEFVEHYAHLASGGLLNKCCEDGIERVWPFGKSRIQRYGRRSGRGINRYDRSKLCQRTNKLCDPSVGMFKPDKGGYEPVAEIRQVSNSEEVGVKKGSPFQILNGFKHERCLPRPSLALYDDVLSRFYVGRKAAFKIWARTEKLTVNDAAVFEWIHDSLLCDALPDTIWCDTIWCQFGNVSNFFLRRKRGDDRINQVSFRSQFSRLRGEGSLCASGIRCG